MIPHKLLTDPTLSDHGVAKVAGVKRHDVTLARHNLLFDLAAENEQLRLRAENAEEFSRVDQEALERAVAVQREALVAVRESSNERDQALTAATYALQEAREAASKGVQAEIWGKTWQSNAGKLEADLTTLRESTAAAVEMQSELTGRPVLHWMVRLFMRRKVESSAQGR